jgi:hypothetical protein
MKLLSYIGIPYKIRGETFDGADCWGICKLFGANELGITFPNYFYDEATNIEEAMEHIKGVKHNLGKQWIQAFEPQLGDICIFRIKGLEVHCGIHLGNNEFLHSLKGRQSSIELLTHVNWVHRYVGSYRWQG